MITYKLILLGDTAVGKTSIVTRYVYKKYNENQNSTIGASFLSYQIDNLYKINVWDSAGQERYKTLVSCYYRDTNIALIVFDINNIKIDNILYWLNDFRYKCNNIHSKIILVGNKYDNLQVDNEILSQNNSSDIDINLELKKIIKEYNLEYFKISAKNNYNIDNLFNHIAIYIKTLQPSINSSTINLENKYKTTKNYLTDYCCFR